MRDNIYLNKYSFAGIILFCYSLINQLINSLSSPIYGDGAIYTDCSVFYLIGKEIIRGKVLYKDLFDHKPPYIHFLNGIASLISFRHIGLFILTTIILFFSIYFAYKIFCIYFDINISIIASLIFAIILTNARITDGMSRTESYAMAFIMPYFYLAIKFFNYTDKEMKTLSDKEYLVLIFKIGILAGMTLMLNLKTVIVFVPFAILLTIKLIKINRYFLLIKLFFVGIFAIFVVIFPYIIYMLITRSFDDMAFSLFYSNAKYFEDTQYYNSVILNLLNGIIAWFLSHVLFSIALIISLLIVLIKEKNKYIKTFYASTLIITYILIASSMRLFNYYEVLLVPFFIPLIVTLINVIIVKFKFTLQNKYLLLLLSMVLLGINTVFGCAVFFDTYRQKHSIAQNMQEIISKKNISIQNAKVLALGFNPDVYSFIAAELKYKFFMIPNTSFDANRVPYEKQYFYVLDKDPDLIFENEIQYIDDKVPKMMKNDIWQVLKGYYDEIGIVDGGNEGIYHIYVKKGS